MVGIFSLGRENSSLMTSLTAFITSQTGISVMVLGDGER